MVTSSSRRATRKKPTARDWRRQSWWLFYIYCIFSVPNSLFLVYSPYLHTFTIKLVVYADVYEYNVKCSKAPQKGYFGSACFILLLVIKILLHLYSSSVIAAGWSFKKNYIYIQDSFMFHMPQHNKLINVLLRLKAWLALRENNEMYQLTFLKVKIRFYASILFVLKSNVLTTLRRK